MTNSRNFFEKCTLSSSFCDLAYRDYISSRLLLNNQLVLQGLTLASTAIEKYLKAIIAFNLNKPEWINYHFDNFSKLKKLLIKVEFEMINEFDSVFIDVLIKAFKIRYYDRLEKDITIGIYLNQFIGELDFVVYNLETYISRKQFNGEKNSPYWRAVESKDPKLYDENYILNGEEKEKFMEKLGYAFSVHIKKGEFTLIERSDLSESISVKYDGQLNIFDEFL